MIDATNKKLLASKKSLARATLRNERAIAEAAMTAAYKAVKTAHGAKHFAAMVEHAAVLQEAGKQYLAKVAELDALDAADAPAEKAAAE